ncbi:hypothetical protein [Actinoplanes sp. NPDC051851]|uniref:hypothetical protein n=1 Tax=Actinoplanes sp. NPDC051851 TaxID=3154753 RepID=UPI0034455B43
MDQDFTDQLYRLRSQLAESRTTHAEQPEPEEQSPSGIGSARDDAVRAAAEAGRLTSVEFDPRLMRLNAAELGVALAEAASAALRACPAAAPAAPGAATPDLQALTRQLGAMQAEAAKAMSMISSGLAEAITKIGDRTGMRGNPDLSDLRRLLDDTSAMARSAQERHAAADGEEQAAEWSGRGGDPEGIVAAEVGPDGHTVALDLQPAALRRPSQDVAEAVTVAVNAALDAREKAATQVGGVPGADTDDLRRRITALQDTSVARMHADTQALTRIMTGIREP